MTRSNRQPPAVKQKADKARHLILRSNDMPGVRSGRNLSITIDTRNDLLFTMSDNTYLSPASQDMPASPSCDETRICFLRTNLIPTGGARRDRTDDLLLAKQALSQLSYGPLPSGETHVGAPAVDW